MPAVAVLRSAPEGTEHSASDRAPWASPRAAARSLV